MLKQNLLEDFEEQLTNLEDSVKDLREQLLKHIEEYNRDIGWLSTHMYNAETDIKHINKQIEILKKQIETLKRQIKAVANIVTNRRVKKL